MSEWKEFRLSDLMRIKYGKDHKHLLDGIIPLYGSGGIMRFVEKPLYEDESILIPRKGTLSNLFYLDRPFWSVDTMFYSVINKTLVFPKYLFYHLKTLDLASLNVGSAVPSLTTEVLNDVKVCIPDLPTQTAIAEILSSLDDKIELNNKINQELETLAQTLFKQWFIDFEFPNENGEPYKSSGGEMVDSKLSEIPEGWEVSEIGLVAKLGAGGDKPKKVSNTPTEELSIPIYSNGITDDGLYGYTNEAKIFEESITISARGTIGFICLRTTPYVPIVRLISVIAVENYVSTKFLYMWLKNQLIVGNGTTQQQLTVPDFRGSKIIIPAKSLVNEFTNQMNLIIDNINFNKKENKELIVLRDTLLPKLISGELEINEINN